MGNVLSMLREARGSEHAQRELNTFKLSIPQELSAAEKIRGAGGMEVKVLSMLRGAWGSEHAQRELRTFKLSIPEELAAADIIRGVGGIVLAVLSMLTLDGDLSMLREIYVPLS